MPVRNPAFLVLAAFSGILTYAHAADAVPSFKEVVLQNVIMGKCHITLGEDDKVAFQKMALASARAEMNEIWGELIATSASNDTDNQRAAVDVFSERLTKATQNAEMKIEHLDCVELERQIKPAGR